MSDMNDQPGQQPRVDGRGTTAAAPGEGTRGYVPRPTPGHDDVSAANEGPEGAPRSG